jgi:cytoskeletal protein RodZ
MAYTLGKQLAQARSQQHLSVEDVAHRTRIPCSILRYLENDDYSHFPNLVYAKSFLKKYSSYLEVDSTEFMQELREASTAQRDSPYLQAQLTREEFAELSKSRLNLDFIPWQKILSALFFIAISVPTSLFIAKLYKENVIKLEQEKTAKEDAAKKELIESKTPAPTEVAPAIPEPNLDPSESGVASDIPKAVPVPAATLATEPTFEPATEESSIPAPPTTGSPPTDEATPTTVSEVDAPSAAAPATPATTGQN